MASPISPRLNRYKLNASFSGKTVTHITLKSNLEAKQRRIEVQTVWETEDRLGAGAFGVVWRQRADTGHVRAVKVIAREQLNIQEVEALIELQDHPDLFILFFGWFEDPDRDAIHIAMEYIEHGHLGKYIAEYQEKVDTKEITSQILEGLVVLHEREICHRDLKPQNILVASLSPIWVKITDFGISKRWVGTSLRTNCGTAIYRSPEQLGILPRELRAAGNAYTNNIDIWALGAIVHEMLTLEIPFLDTYVNQESGFTSCISTEEDVVDTGLLYGYCHGAKPFPCASLRSHGVTEDGIDFVKSLMAVNPSERLSAATALASEWLAQTDITAAPASPTTTLPPPQQTTSTTDGEPRAEMDCVAEVVQHPDSPPASSKLFQPLDSGYQTDITSEGSLLPSPVSNISDRVDITPLERTYSSVNNGEQAQAGSLTQEISSAEPRDLSSEDCSLLELPAPQPAHVGADQPDAFRMPMREYDESDSNSEGENLLLNPTGQVSASLAPPPTAGGSMVAIKRHRTSCDMEPNVPFVVGRLPGPLARVSVFDWFADRGTPIQRVYHPDILPPDDRQTSSLMPGPSMQTDGNRAVGAGFSTSWRSTRVPWSVSGLYEIRIDYPEWRYSDVLFVLKQNPKRYLAIRDPKAALQWDRLQSYQHPPVPQPVSRVSEIRIEYPKLQYSDVLLALQQTPERSRCITGSEDAPELRYPAMYETMDGPHSRTPSEDAPEWDDRTRYERNPTMYEPNPTVYDGNPTMYDGNRTMYDWTSITSGDSRSFVSEEEKEKPARWAGIVDGWLQKLSK